MDSYDTLIPFVWPVSPKLADCQEYPHPVPYHSILPGINSMFGVVSGIDDDGVRWLEQLIDEFPNLRFMLVLALYGACGTQHEHLERLLMLQEKTGGRVEFHLLTTSLCFFSGAPSNLLCFVPTEEQSAFMATGPTPNFGFVEPLEAQANLVFRADASLIDSWRKWFDLLWFKSSPLTDSTTNIPLLTPAKGTEEAAEQWRRYEDACREVLDPRQTEVVLVEIDPETGEVTARDAEGNEVTSPTANLEIPRLDPVGNRIAKLYTKGAVVTVDKASRIPPLDAPIKAEWFGMDSFRQIGAVSREVKYRISVIDKRQLNALDTIRTKIKKVISNFSYPLAENLYWMPNSARKLFEQEVTRLNDEGKALLNKTVGDNLDSFINSQLDRITKDANSMYQDFYPNGKLDEGVIKKIVDDLKDRLQKALGGRFIPQVSYAAINFTPTKESDSVSPWGQALSLLEAVAKFPREVLTDHYKTMGVKVDGDEYEAAMNVLDDSVLKARFKKIEVEKQLDQIREIMGEKFSHRDKCELLLAIIDGKNQNALHEMVTRFAVASEEGKK